jgi:putative transposase
MQNVERQNLRVVRKRLRLGGFDYSTPGYYFVTICVLNRRCLFGDVQGEHVVMNALGQVVSNVWLQVPQRHGGIILDAFVVMPNHLHALLQLTGKETSLSGAIGAFKSQSTNAARTAGCLVDARLWQRGFHDHVARGEADLDRLREYIANNPLKWHLDRENPANILPAAGRAGTSPAPTG